MQYNYFVCKYRSFVYISYGALGMDSSLIRGEFSVKLPMSKEPLVWFLGSDRGYGAREKNKLYNLTRFLKKPYKNKTLSVDIIIS